MRELIDGKHNADALAAYKIEAAIEKADRLIRGDPTLSTTARTSYETERAEAMEVLSALKQRMGGRANAL
ncbi:MAG TPA: hypothetical protein VGR63_19045 [Casimicrobiaceae bacterium]|jgi:hypothetical protein|nr:hypothetical protein [Casimicrobiaceae bacterium]